MARTTTNSEGKPIIPLTDTERYTFDNKGWLCLPGLLEPDELKAMHDFAYQLKEHADDCPPGLLRRA